MSEILEPPSRNLISKTYFGQSFKYQNGYSSVCYNNFLRGNYAQIFKAQQANIKKCTNFKIDWNQASSMGYGGALDSKGDAYFVILFLTNQKSGFSKNGK